MKPSSYTAGAGHVPPVLAGRDELLRDWQLVLNDIVAAGRVRAQDIILAGPRGVGKTVTVSAFAGLAKAQGFEVVNLQAVSGHAGLVDGLLQRARSRLADEAGPWQRARQAFERIGVLVDRSVPRVLTPYGVIRIYVSGGRFSTTFLTS